MHTVYRSGKADFPPECLENDLAPAINQESQSISFSVQENLSHAADFLEFARRLHHKWRTALPFSEAIEDRPIALNK